MSIIDLCTGLLRDFISSNVPLQPTEQEIKNSLRKQLHDKVTELLSNSLFKGIPSQKLSASWKQECISFQKNREIIPPERESPEWEVLRGDSPYVFDGLALATCIVTELTSSKEPIQYTAIQELAYRLIFVSSTYDTKPLYDTQRFEVTHGQCADFPLEFMTQIPTFDMKIETILQTYLKGYRENKTDMKAKTKYLYDDEKSRLKNIVKECMAALEEELSFTGSITVEDLLSPTNLNLPYLVLAQTIIQEFQNTLNICPQGIPSLKVANDTKSLTSHLLPICKKEALVIKMMFLVIHTFVNKTVLQDDDSDDDTKPLLFDWSSPSIPNWLVSQIDSGL